MTQQYQSLTTVAKEFNKPCIYVEFYDLQKFKKEASEDFSKYFKSHHINLCMQVEFKKFMKDWLPDIKMIEVINDTITQDFKVPYRGTLFLEVEINSAEYNLIVNEWEDDDMNSIYPDGLNIYHIQTI